MAWPRLRGAWCALLWLGLAGAPCADAHAVLRGSEPARDQALAAPPTELVLTFNEPVRPAVLRVLDATGHQVEYAGAARVRGASVVQGLGGTLAPGAYLVFWRVMADDGHVASGTFAFRVAAPRPVATPAVAPSVPPARPTAAAQTILPMNAPPAVPSGLIAAACALRYGAGLLALGSLLLLAWMTWPEATRGAVVRQGRAATLVLGASLLLALASGGADMQGIGLAGLGSATAWQAALASSLGTSAGFGLAGAVLGWFALGRRSVLLLHAAAALVLASFVVTGHAATAPPVMIVAPTVGMHVLTAAFWSAALWPLLSATARLSAEESGALLEAFSARAAGLVLLLLVSGAVLMLVQLGPLHNLVRTAYGVRLSFKIAAAVGLLVFASVNNLRLTPALRRGEARAARWLRVTVRAELALMLLVVALAASLTLLPPPRTLEPAAQDLPSAAPSRMPAPAPR